MKASNYNIFYCQGDKNYVFQQITKSLIQIDSELFNALSHGQIEQIPKDELNQLYDMGIVTSDDFNESDPIIIANLKNRYASNHLRVTVMPTLNCNFRCWYCYESHKPSVMSHQSMTATLAFIKDEAIRKEKKQILLDWFGGEPMMYFEKIVYPLSKSLKDWCTENDITFSCQMTSNGSLITLERASMMNDIGLKQFQITLDGGKVIHNQTRFSKSIPNSFDRIVANIHTICRIVQGATIDLRINYTPENIDTLHQILEEFESDIRDKIFISPHIVWQKSEEIVHLRGKILQLEHDAENYGYPVLRSLSRSCVSCYTENIDQYVINYDLNVYKCTARDFDDKNTIGKILPDGKFQPNSLYFKFCATQAPFVNDTCLNCNILPSCMFATSCIQKSLEKNTPKCCKELILEHIYNNISGMINYSHQTQSI